MFKRFFCLLTLFVALFFMAHPAGAQTTTAARADSLYAQARALDDGDPEQWAAGVALLRQVISMQTELGRLKELGAAWNVLGHFFRSRDQQDSAWHAYTRARDIRQRAGDLIGVAASINNLGNVYTSRGQLDSAVIHYRRSIQMGHDLGDQDFEADILRNLGIAHTDSAATNRMHADSALAAFRRSLALFTQLGDSAKFPGLLEWIGIVHVRAAAPDSAIAAWHQGIAAVRDPKDPLRADLLNRIAATYRSADRADSALVYYRRTAAAARMAGDSVATANALLNIGRHYSAVGELDAAARYTYEALAASRSTSDRSLMTTALRQLANQHRQRGSYDSANVVYREALKLARETGEVAAQSEILIAIAQLHYTVMRFDSAVVAYHAALNTARTAGDRSTEAWALTQFSQYHASMVAGQDSALHYAGLALPIHRELGEVSEEARALQYIGRAHLVRDSALHYLWQAHALARRLGDLDLEYDVHIDLGRVLPIAGLADSAVASYQRAREIAVLQGDPLREAEALKKIGQAYGPGRDPAMACTIGHEDRCRWAPPGSAAKPLWRLAAAYYDSSWIKLESVRRTARGERARIQFANLFLNAARLIMDAWTKDAEETGSQFSERMALAASERGRAQALLDLMQGPDLIDTEPLEAAATKLVADVAKPSIATITYVQGSGKLFATLTLPTGHVETFDVTVADSTIKRQVAGLRQTLRVDSASTRAVGNLEPEIFFRAGSARRTPEAALKELSDVLLPAELRQALTAHPDVTELVVVPSAEITLVPFAALPLGEQPLGLTYRLRYAPSLSALVRAEQRPQPARGTAQAKSLVIGNPEMPSVRTVDGDSMQLTQLGGAEREAQQVANRLGGDLVIGTRATETLVKERMPHTALLHLATHGYAYSAETRARASFVALAPDAQNDGLLTVGEVLDGPQLHTDLVVLSACQTALGNTTSAEGTVGLHWAFLAKGARSLLVSLWNVDDRVTEQMMIRFYTHWAAGATKAEALRLAQAEIRRDFPNPRYWAAFQLVGAN